MSSTTPPSARRAPVSVSFSLAWPLVGVAVAWGVTSALLNSWTCDDAYIVFRYAKNLHDGLGLVFNAGERVEGYTDFLWVLLQWPAFALGIAPDKWANAWGIGAYVGSIVLLGVHHVRLKRRLSLPWWTFPVAALAAAFHPDWNDWATGGLETSFFTFLLLAGFTALAGDPPSTRSAGAAGAVFALAALTRPDGLLPAAVAGVFVLLTAERRWRATSAFGLVFGLIWAPETLFRITYYGSIFPNTYYAKSASIAWWSQGFRYLTLYLDKYWVLGVLPVLVAALILTTWFRAAQVRASGISAALLAGALGTTYVLYVMRVGGDFMYARMLIPPTAFFLIAIEESLWRCAGVVRPVGIGAIALLVTFGPLLRARPVTGSRQVSGVADEREYYSPKRTSEADFQGEVLRRFFHDLPVRLVVFGAEVRLGYQSEASYLLEVYGLTDPIVARARLARRGRVGHEKMATPSYVVSGRHIHLALNAYWYFRLGYERVIPTVPIRFGPVRGFILQWDPVLLAQLKYRGAVFEDFPAWLDGYESRIAELSDEQVRSDYARIGRFYFNNVQDPAREAAFLRRLRQP